MWGIIIRLSFLIKPLHGSSELLASKEASFQYQAVTGVTAVPFFFDVSLPTTREALAFSDLGK